MKYRLTTVAGAAALCALMLLGQAAAQEGVLRAPLGKPSPGPPEGWKVKQWKGESDFSVVEAPFGPAVHLKSSSSSSALYREMELNIAKYPYLSWRWKATKLPRGADVRKKETDDQAAQVYVVFHKWPPAINSLVIGYIWDSSAPAGLNLQSTKSRNTRYVVMRSGAGELGSWLQETRNVHKDFKKLFGGEPPKVGSLSVMIDSDDTGSSAESFIGDIYFSKEPPSR